MAECRNPSEPPSSSPLFRPWHDHALRALLVLGSLGIVTGPLAAWCLWRSDIWQRVNIPYDQPVLFSHRHHVDGLGIDCRYCHTGVETSSYAGIPSTETCMTCHSQIWTDAPLLEPVRTSFRTGARLRWRRINDLPDFVYFDHSIHVQRGVACVTCHGRVDQMPITYKPFQMTMAWCLECHRNPEPRLVPVSQVTSAAPLSHHVVDGVAIESAQLAPLLKARLTNCTVCHR